MISAQIAMLLYLETLWTWRLNFPDTSPLNRTFWTIAVNFFRISAVPLFLGGAMRDDPKNGCEGDYSFVGERQYSMCEVAFVRSCVSLPSLEKGDCSLSLLLPRIVCTGEALRASEMWRWESSIITCSEMRARGYQTRADSTKRTGGRWKSDKGNNSLVFRRFVFYCVFVTPLLILPSGHPLKHTGSTTVAPFPSPYFFY